MATILLVVVVPTCNKGIGYANILYLWCSGDITKWIHASIWTNVEYKVPGTAVPGGSLALAT